MEKQTAGPVIIRFEDYNDMVNFTIRMRLKYVLAKLLYSDINDKV